MLSHIFKLNTSKEQKNITKTTFHSAHAVKSPTAMRLTTKAKPSFTSDYAAILPAAQNCIYPSQRFFLIYKYYSFTYIYILI